MDKSILMKDMYSAIIDLDRDLVLKLVDEVVKADLDIVELISQAMSPAMEEVGRQFQSGEKFLPELQMSADVFQAAMKVLNPFILKQKGEIQPKGRAVIGTVKGDLHSIGKDLVTTMLKTNGFEVWDLGIDVSPGQFLEGAEKSGARVIGLSALLTTTMPAQQEVIEMLKQKGLRDKYKVIVGGAPVDAEWAQKIGADGYGADAAAAVKLVHSLCL